MSLLISLAVIVTGCFCRLFYRLGHVVGRYPVIFISVPLVACGGLGVFFLYAPHDSDLEDMYTPRNSRARADRDRVKELFPEGSGDNFNPVSLNDHPLGAALIVQHRNKSNLLDPKNIPAIHNLTNRIRNISMILNISIVVPKKTSSLASVGLNMTSEGVVTSGNYVTMDDYVEAEGKVGDDVDVMTIQRLVTWNDVCARLRGKCQIEGVYMFSEEFKSACAEGKVTYPYWVSPWGVMDLSRTMGRVSVTGQGNLTDVTAVRFIFNLRRDSQHYKFLSLEWEKRYLEVLQEIEADLKPLDVAFATSHSVSNELNKATVGDLHLFLLTFLLIVLYSSLVTSGGDCVTSRVTLARAGVLAAALGIFGSLGLVSLVGVPFVNIVACMPFLVLGIGVDDMFLMMAAWSGTLGNRELTIPKRLGSTFRTAGIGITITSLTDGLAFAVGGVTSVFQSIRNFCIYTGTAVFLCYLSNLLFFGGCMALHGRRMYSQRHNITCRKVKSQQELKAEGRTWCYRHCCGGSVADRVGQEESVCERGPRLLLPRLVLWTPAKVIIGVCFLGFLGVSIWGTTRLEQGLLRKNLVLPSSFYYKYNVWEENLFGVTFPISFVIDQPLDYSNSSSVGLVWQILNTAREDPDINALGTSCWLADFLLSPYSQTSSSSSSSCSSSSSSSSSSSNETFVKNLQHKFLPHHPHYISDIVIDEENDVIVASRCHVTSHDVRESKRQAELMTRMRRVADEAPIKVFAYQPIFVFFEQYSAIVPNTILTVGVTLVAMFVVSAVLLVHPLMVLLVLFNVIMIVIGIFGFMALWGLTLSSVTMIHLIMSVGFSVDFSAHVCAAYMTSEESARQARARHALVHASGPILNGGLSSFVGIIALIFSESYIFQSFFKIMFLVILFGVLHAVFLTPVILSLIGPQLSRDETHTDRKKDYSNSANDNICDEGALSVISSSTSQGKKGKESFNYWLGGMEAFENQNYDGYL